jgi:hypothetical protein
MQQTVFSKTSFLPATANEDFFVRKDIRYEERKNLVGLQLRLDKVELSK